MVTAAGFEPATCPLGGGCSIQLSHGAMEPWSHSAKKIRHLRQFLRINSHGEDSLSTHDLSLNVCQCGPNV